MNGRVVPVMALAIAVFLVCAVIADAGYWRYEYQLAQNAADIAASAGASSLSRSADVTAALAAATSATNSDRLNRSGENTLVSFSVRALRATRHRARPLDVIEVVVSRRAPAFFANADGPNYRTVNAQAEVQLSTAAVRTLGAASPAEPEAAAGSATAQHPTGRNING